jgi:hypothetical protein
MKLVLRNTIVLVCLFASMVSSGQSIIRLKSRSFQPERNVEAFSWSKFTQSKRSFSGKYFAVLQFDRTVSEEQKQLLLENGVELLTYIPGNSFSAVISKPISKQLLLKTGVSSLVELEPSDKLSHRLIQKNIPSWAIKERGKVDVIVHFSKAVDASQTKDYFNYKGYSIIDQSWISYHFLSLRIPQSQIQTLVSIPFVEYVEPVAPQPKTFNYLMRANTRANVLNAPVSAGGENLKGQGVTIGIGDDADPSNHVDLRDKVINRAAGIQNTHGTHVSGIAAGGGIKEEIFQGVAPLATIVSQLFAGIYLNAAAYVADYHMMVANNSWGNITGECDLTGVYDTYSKLMDDISIQYPYLLNVFAAGNDGPFTCQPFPLQYHTIVSGHQSAKNVISVAWGEKNLTVSANSSVGPTADGRMKPEIISQGSGVRSTAPNNDYFTDWGTSMAAPTVAGGAALLIEKYRQLNGGADPKSGLVKALLMNGAMDIDRPAPDFKSGYGWLNLIRSLDILKNNRYITATVNSSATNNHSITVPAGVSQLKVMIYWHDPSAAIFAQNALVNDLDLEVNSPSGIVLPWKLNPSSTGVNTDAVRAADHLNNSEQVTIDNPSAGTYTINVKGTSINSGASQEYFVVYDFVPTGIDLTNPSVGDPFIPGETMFISWDAWGGPQNPFTLQYTTDGTNWIDINTSLPASSRQYSWVVPNVATDKAKVRLLRNGTAFVDEGQPFTIMSQPIATLSPVQCEGYINLDWNAIPGATDYEVMMKKGVQVVGVATTTSTNYVFSGLNKDSTYWVTVRARLNSKPGRRAVAVSRQPNNGTCAGNISNNDLKLDTILSPSSGRKFTSTEITTTSLQVRIKNLDDAPVTGFTVSYSINGAPFVSQNVTATIPANSTYVHTFTGLNFSAVGNYNVVAVVKNNTPDAVTANDTATKAIRQIANPAITLPYTENFDAAPSFEITKDTTGLPGLDKWDFTNSTDFGRVRSFVNTGIAKSGNRAITLDALQYTPTGNINYLIGTFNLSNYTSTPAQITGLILEFSYKHHGQQPNPNNRVWARRSDTDPWIQVCNLDTIDLHAGTWKTISIHLANTAAAQSPTSSFQIRFGQQGILPMGDNTSNAGYTIDDITLTTSTADIELISVEAPAKQGCGYSAATPLTIKFSDHYGIAACIPVKYRVDGGAVVSECTASTGPIDTYTFLAKLNLSSPGLHTIDVFTDHPADTYRKNDTIHYIIFNNTVINNFPYIENFESNNGGWHTEGNNSSWQWGTPASYKINKAASGTKAWKTTLRGQYNENELSYLYSPCFNIASLSDPYLRFNMALDIEDCGSFICDKAWMEYSTDGRTWTKLGAYGQGTNWYNRATDNVWDSASFTNWHVAAIALPKINGTIQLRFVMESDAGVVREGIAIDDVQVYNNNGSTTNEWSVFPNPFTNTVNLVSCHPAASNVAMQLYNAIGQLVATQSFTASGGFERNTLNTSYLAKGVYLLKVNDGITSKLFKLVK